MKLAIPFLLLLLFQKKYKLNSNVKATFIKIEMTLSAFGVESDRYPNIISVIDFKNDTSYCKRSFYNPAYTDSSYLLTKAERAIVLKLLNNADLGSLAKEYKTMYSDQPTSTTTIYTNKDTFHVKDYGILAPHPLDSIYKIVYKPEVNIR